MIQIGNFISFSNSLIDLEGGKVVKIPDQLAIDLSKEK
jgi:hypothetical protein